MVVSNGIIIIDSREKKQEYIKKYFDDIGGIESTIACLQHGIDYMIINGNQCEDFNGKPPMKSSSK